MKYEEIKKWNEKGSEMNEENQKRTYEKFQGDEMKHIGRMFLEIYEEMEEIYQKGHKRRNGDKMKYLRSHLRLHETRSDSVIKSDLSPTKSRKKSQTIAKVADDRR